MYVAILFVLFAAAHAQTVPVVPTVNTTQGVIIGAYNNGIANFYGIHYAGPASGSNRFKNPTPAPVYPGEYHAVDNNIICAHPTPRGLVGVEDCLVLSIHTNNLAASNPVMVWLEGEDYDTISNIPYSYDNLVQQDIVFVSVNYRLSIFGFLCLGVPEAPGNVGLKDVVQALTWIQQNIAGFGGNPGNVMLFGHGSGAAMVDLITLSGKADELVHKAMVLSGSALSPSAVAYEPVAYAHAVGDKMGYTGKTNSELAELLSSTATDLLVNAINDFEFYNNTPLFAPCVENPQLNNDTFLTDSPINILRSGNYSHVPYIIGYVDREGTIRAQQALFSNWLTKMESNFSDFLQADLKFESETNKTAVARTIREFYFAQSYVGLATIEDFLDYQGDSLITMAVIRGARERAATSRADVRIFEFAYKRTVDPEWAYPQIQLTGVRHGGLLSYVFDYNLSTLEISLRNLLTSRIAMFARTGSQGGYPNFTMWDPISSSGVFHLLYISGGEVSTNVTIGKEEARGNIREETTNFWNSIYNAHYRAPTPISGATSARLAFSLVPIFIALRLLLN
ncbi:venom carboxylesterase-6-like [Aricia agestis]|uniref:venom carboxylesterase-6-like n=1 Tax=Aricia agestis TaxID=91739 RepID=UPI001C208619|nr:venom carboxylesterase-6-like [Aricia agestis]